MGELLSTQETKTTPKTPLTMATVDDTLEDMETAFADNRQTEEEK